MSFISFLKFDRKSIICLGAWFDVYSESNLNALYRELEREVSDRVANLPRGSTQKIVLDVTGRGFSKEIISEAVEGIQRKLMNIYPNIPIDIVGV